MCRYSIEIDSTPKPGVPYRIRFLLEKIKISNSDSDRRFVRSNGQQVNHRNKDLEINGTSTRINSSPGASGHILLNGIFRHLTVSLLVIDIHRSGIRGLSTN